MKPQKLSGDNLRNALLVHASDKLTVAEELPGTDRKRLEVLAELAETGAINLGSALQRLFGTQDDAAQSNFRGFRKRFNDVAKAVGCQVVFEVDSAKRTPPAERTCWFLGPDPAAANAERFSRESVADIQGAPRVAPRGTMTTTFEMEKPKGTPKPLRVFISYAQKDKALVDDLKERLETKFKALRLHHASFWMDRFAIHPGEEWDASIEEALATCDFALLLTGDAFFSRPYIAEKEIPWFTQNEAGITRKPCVPVCLHPLDPDTFKAHHLDHLQAYRYERTSDGEFLSYSECQKKLDKSRFVDALFRRIQDRFGPFSVQPAFQPTPQVQDCDPDRDDGEVYAEHLRGWSGELPKHLQRTRAHLTRLQGLEDLDGKAQPEQEGKDALQELLTWATATGPEAARFCAVLGEYGMGKTTTLKMFTQGLLDRKAKGEDVPLPIYVDLRLQLGAPDDVPTLEELLTEVIRRNHRLGDRSPLKPNDLLRLVRAEGAVMIFDGLDEKIVHLPPAKATAYIHMLWGVLPPVERHQPAAPGKRPGRLILSCRSHYFRDVFSQDAMLTGQDREGIRREEFPALLLLPFSEAQIRGYLRDMLGDETRANEAFALVEKIHNLRDLAARPVLLSHIAEHLGELEQAAMRGEVVNAARLYDTVVKRWLSRDDGKHQLDPLHKRLLMERLAGKLAAEGSRELEADALEMWLDEFLLAEPAIAGAYAHRDRAVLKEDLRAATFVVRPESGENSGSFRFAHTSLEEFFLACHLHRALVENHPERWDLGSVSRETYDFLVQLLQIKPSPTAKSTWEHVLGGSQARAARHGFLLWLRAQEIGGPIPQPAKVCLDGVDLEDLRIQGTPGHPMDLRGASLQNSELSRTRWRDVLLTDANLSGADVRQAEFVRVEAHSASFVQADLCGTTWRQGSLVEANFTSARTQGLSIFDAPGPQELHTQCFISAMMEVSQVSCPEYISPIRGHYSCITSASWSPDGTRILSSANDNSLLVWDAAAGKLILKLAGHKNTITSCAWSPKGTRILSGSKDQSLCIWDSTSGILLRTILGHKGIVTSCAWSPDESQIISGSTDSFLRVWDSSSGQLRLVLAGHESSVCSCDWSRDGFRILSSANDTSMRVWDSATGNLVLEFLGHRDRVTSCCWSPDGSRILSGSDDDTLRIWDSSTGKSLLELKGHRFPITSCAWSHDGLRILSSSEDGSIRIWDSRCGHNILSISYNYMATCCAWSPNSSRILSGSEDHTLRVMDSYSGRLLIEFKGQSNFITSCSWSPDGSRIVYGSNKNALLVLEASSRVDKTLIMHHQSSVRSCSWSPDGTHLVSGSRDHKLRIWDSESGALVRELFGHQSWVSSCSWSPDGSRILSGSWDKTLRVWDPFSGRLIRAIEAQKNRISTCAWSPDSSKILCDSANNSLCIFNASSGKILLTILGHQQRITSCAWSQDGAFILSGSSDSSLRIWDAKSGNLALALSGHRYAVTCCAWSPGGARILSGSGDTTLRVWNPNSGILIHELCGHQAPISSCAWSLDGSRILSGSHDNTLRVWDAYTGSLLKIYYVLPENEWAAVRGDQRKLLASSENAWRHLGWREVDEQGRFVRWLPLDARVGPPE